MAEGAEHILQKPKERNRGWLMRSREFKEFMKAHPDFLSRARAVIDQIHQGYSSRIVERDHSDPITIKRHEHYETRSPYYQLSYAGRDFLVKLEGHASAFDQGYAQAQATKKAERILRESNLENVQIIPWHLGYSDKKSHYYVAEWRGDLETLGRITGRLARENPQEALRLDDRVAAIVNVLQAQGYNDVDKRNMFYDPQSDTILLFDLSQSKQPPDDDSFTPNN